MDENARAQGLKVLFGRRAARREEGKKGKMVGYSTRPQASTFLGSIRTIVLCGKERDMARYCG